MDFPLVIIWNVSCFNLFVKYKIWINDFFVTIFYKTCPRVLYEQSIDTYNDLCRGGSEVVFASVDGWLILALLPGE